MAATDVDEARELAILSVFAKFGQQAGPSVRDVRSELQQGDDSMLRCSVHTLQRVLERLVDKGDLINVDPLRERRRGGRAAGSLRLSAQGMDRLLRALPPESELHESLRESLAPPPLLPVVALLSAGHGVDVEGAQAEFAEGQTLLDVLEADSRDQVFIVRGRSMVYAGIEDGNYVIIRRIETTEDVTPRDVVVAIVRKGGMEEATLKYLRRTPGELQLVPAHFGGYDWQGNEYDNQTYTLGVDDVWIVGVLRWTLGGPPANPKATLPASPRT
jgi:hypothetical protein